MQDLTGNLSYILAILGAYFAILLVLAVAVETILEPFTLFKGLRKKISPEEFMKDMNEWLPKGSPGGTKAIAIANFTKEFNANVKNLEDRVKEIGEIADETAAALGPDAVAVITTGQKNLVVRMSEIREKYDFDERKRIAILRVLSAVVGILLAVALQLDTIDMLATLFPQEIQDIFNTQIAHYGGMLLTGLAASAGSSFWHDQLGKVRALKEASRRIQDVTRSNTH